MMTPEYIQTQRELMEYEAARKENLYYSHSIVSDLQTLVDRGLQARK